MLRCDPAALAQHRRHAGATRAFVLAAVGLAASLAGVAAPTDLSPLPLPTLAFGSALEIKPNILMVLDDSGSMDWDFLPDWSNLGQPFREPPPGYAWPILPASPALHPTTSTTGTPFVRLNFTRDVSPPSFLLRNAAFNGVAYNPAVRYAPPVTFTSAGAKDTTKYPSMTGTSAATGANMDAALPKPNWKAVVFDGYGVQKQPDGQRPATDLEAQAFFYTVLPGEYCDSPALTNCTTAAAPNGKFQYAAPLRWCNSNALTQCQGLWSGTFNRPRIPQPRITTMVFAVASSTVVSSIKVDGQEILSAPTTGDNTSGGVAARVLENINACTLRITGKCTTLGYYAVSAGFGALRVYAPRATSGVPQVTYTGTMALTAPAFARDSIPLPEWSNGGARSTGTVPGENVLTVIARPLDPKDPGSFPYPGSATKAPGRDDCAGTTCTYQEEMTNYANWWAYYRTRMQMMKTATARAFSSLDTEADIAAGKTRYRIGYLSINNNTKSDFVNIADFDAGQKFTWFSRLFAAVPSNATPLRAALSTAGRLYGGVLNGTILNGTKVTDPLQFSCQRNYTILSTDGYWNGDGGVKLDGTTAMDNQDGGLPRPFKDGASSSDESRTSELQKVETQQTAERGILQIRTSRDGPWSDTTSCRQNNGGGNKVECQYRWEAAAGTPTCEPRWQKDDFTRATVFRNCKTTLIARTNAASCTPSGTDLAGRTVSCEYSDWSVWSNIASCSPVPRSSGPNFTVGTARECRTTTTGGTENTLADIAAYYYNRDLRDPLATGPDVTGTCTGPIVPPATRASDLCENNVEPFDRDNNPRQHMTTHTLGLGAQGQMVYSRFQNDLQGNKVFQPDYWSQQTGDFVAVSNATPASPSTGICPWMSAGTTCTWPSPAPDSTANIDDLWHAAVNGHGTYFSAADPLSLGDALSGMLGKIKNPPSPGTAAAAATSNPNVTPADNFVFSSSYQSVQWFGELIMQVFVDNALSPQKWSAMQLLDCATSPWRPNRDYLKGDAFQHAGVCYGVRTKTYKSGATFDGSPTGIDAQNTVKLEGTPVTRKIYTVGTTAGNPTLIPFTWDSLGAAQRTLFARAAISQGPAGEGLTQFCAGRATCLDDGAQEAAAGEALVNFLRGDRTHEGSWYRERRRVLGDIVSSQVSYVKAPLQDYLDPGFAAFKENMATRPATVYVGANDGMLHAFDAVTGQERWAFIPSAVLPDLYRLADMDYANRHRYFVDGSPEVGDICPKAAPATCTADEWRTILVGGLNQGGKTYYALDITDPLAPKLLWEYTHENMGFSYGNPRITKLRNGNWVVVVASGYNSNDGIGRVYVLNAATGALVNRISTSAGSPSAPSGLAKLQARVPNGVENNTVEQVYGGDLLGNVWRFDVNDAYGVAGTDAQLLVQLVDAGGNPQPITTTPEVAAVGDKPLVMIGTGRYLGQSDLNDNRTNSMYAIMDKLDATTLSSPRGAVGNFVQQTISEVPCPKDADTSTCTPGETVRTATANPVDWGVRNGWFIDFPLRGERAVTDAQLALGTISFTTVQPQPPVTGIVVGCDGPATPVAARSFLYSLDFLTGSAVQGTSGVVGGTLCTCVATSVSVIMTTDGDLKGLIRASGGPGEDQDDQTGMGRTIVKPLPYQRGGNKARRLSWRELNGD